VGAQGTKVRGRIVTEAREALGLSHGEFARVLGVHASTVYRWEALTEFRADPLHDGLLTLLIARGRALPQLGAQIRNQLARGPVYALRALLDGVL
jgi:DNA-binding transcriptional regulator YiaG